MDVKIIKHGYKHAYKNLGPKLFVCKNCGCVYMADSDTYEIYDNGKHDIKILCDCPECKYIHGKPANLIQRFIYKNRFSK